ncbi:MAG: HTTM domain-containing protein, partial [Mycobacterium sp.]
MHTAIMVTITVGFFTLAMFVLYLAFIPPETVQHLPPSAKRMATKPAVVLRRRRPSGKDRSGDTETTEPGGVVAKGSAASPAEAPDHR